jgi:hypothetical protein
MPGEISGFSWRMFKDKSGRLAPVPSIDMLRDAVHNNH